MMAELVPGHLLVVDDNRVSRLLLVHGLEQEGHTVESVENGRQALDMLRTKPFDLVLLDVEMPQMDGYQTLSIVKKDDALRHIPVIMVTAIDEMDSTIRCIEMGAEDYLPKPFNPVLLRARIDASLEKKRLRDQEQLYLKGLERELEIASEIQAGFLPSELPQIPGWDIAASLKSAREVAGDFYDVFPFRIENKIGLVIADVCDKGVAAALFMTLFRSLIRAVSNVDYFTEGRLSPFGANPSESRLKTAVSLTNNYIANVHGDTSMFATLFFGMLDPSTGKLSYINAGHEPPLIINDHRIRAALEKTGPAVGIIPNWDFAVQEVQLAPDEILFAFTDGVADTLNGEDESFGKERLLSLLTTGDQTPSALLTSINAELQEFMADTKQFDDITLLAARQK